MDKQHTRLPDLLASLFSNITEDIGFLSIDKNFVEFLPRFFTQTLKGHISVTNKDTEMRQTFSESSICALFSRPAALFVAGR